MIISIKKAESLVDFKGWSDEKIKMKLDAIEQTIRAYTNNNFQNRAYRKTVDITGGLFVADSAIPFKVGDTIQVSNAGFNAGLYTVASVDGLQFTVNEPVTDEKNVLCTKIEYPADVIACVVNLLEWEVNSRGKVGVQSETISRHSVTYFNMDGGNQTMGYPSSLLGCLKPYMKARF